MADQFNRVAKAIADPRRFGILQRIASRGELSCQALLAVVPVSQPTMSHHLRELASAGLIEPRREGQCVHYRFRADVLDAYVRELESRLTARAFGARGTAPARGASAHTRGQITG